MVAIITTVAPGENPSVGLVGEYVTSVEKCQESLRRINEVDTTLPPYSGQGVIIDMRWDCLYLDEEFVQVAAKLFERMKNR